MNTIEVCTRVRLTTDVPTLWLRRGEVGVVRSLWFTPTAAYEVEFTPDDQQCRVRALLFPGQLERVEQPTAAK